jgi:hypothetical protein
LSVKSKTQASSELGQGLGGVEGTRPQTYLAELAVMVP